MATMATSHGLSVLTNACVKTPIHPLTGLSATLHERPATANARLSTVYYDDYDEDQVQQGDILDFTTNPTTRFDDASVLQLSNLSDEEFYQKLLQLKNEQRKILAKCEHMYLAKHRDDGFQPFASSRYEDQSGVTASFNGLSENRPDAYEGIIDRRALSPALREGGLTPPLPGSPPLDSVRDLYSKPPTGRPPAPLVAKSLTSPPLRPSSAPLSRLHARSLDDLRQTAMSLRRSIEDLSGDEFGDDERYIPDDTVSELYRPRDISMAMSRIDDMWDNFAIEDYAPRRSQQRPSSASVTRREKAKTDSWRHRLTVPKPFSMTLREGSKEKKKSKTLEELEEQRFQKEQEEEEECLKKFKAAPVPAHVYLPLYDEIVEKGEQRRRYIRQCSEELLRSQQKPFNFVKREEDRKQQLQTERECTTSMALIQSQEKKKEGFKAKPVPKYVFDNVVTDKMMEEEEYRKIRKKMRSEELLRASSLPPNMAARQQMIEQKERERMTKSSRKKHHHQRSRINHEVPNYDALYRQFQQELQRRKAAREGTVTRPFRLETHRTLSSKEKIKRDIKRDEETLNETRWPFKNPRTKPKNLGHISVSLDSLPSKSTKSADVRSSQVKTQMSHLKEHEKREIEEDRRRRTREMKLRRMIRERAPKETPRDSFEERKKKNKAAERARMEEYEQELKEMKDRVHGKPLLFERESQTNAKKAAEKKFNATLKSVGLDEDFVNSRGSRSGSFHDSTDDYDDDFEDTYVKRQDSDRAESPMEAY